jgi:hypothetical protein
MNIGYQIGFKYNELSTFRDRNSKRDLSIISMLQYITNVIWKGLFDKSPESLEKSNSDEAQCKFFLKSRFCV